MRDALPNTNISSFLTRFVALLLCALPLVPAYGDGMLVEPAVQHSGEFVYDARMAFLKAGELSLAMTRSGADYEVLGEFQTSRAMSNYYSWNGVFAAVGRWERAGPVTTAYMSRTTSKDSDLRIVLTYPDATRVLDGSNEEFESVAHPGGVDLISALFFYPTCYEGGAVHDGEDAYQLTLKSKKTHRLRGGSRYYQGEVTSCDYLVRDHKDRKRRVVVSLGDVNGATVAVQVRAKIPLLPDAVFRLRTDTPAAEADSTVAAR